LNHRHADFQSDNGGSRGALNQSLAALATPLPRPTKAHPWDTQSELVAILAQARRNRLGTEYVDLLVFWELDLRPNHVAVAVGAMADPLYAAPTRSVWEESRHSWITFNHDVSRFLQQSPPPPK